MLAIADTFRPLLPLALTAAAALFAVPARADSDPLPSWNDTAPKAAIIDFVRKVTTEGTHDFVPPADRIAVFDSDGTIMVEQPVPAQLAFELDCVSVVSFKHPEWSKTQPFMAAVERDTKGLAAAGEKGFSEIMVATHAGWTTEDFDTTLSGWIASELHPRFGRRYSETVYQPMLELLAYLRDNGFKTVVVSAGTVEFLRSFGDATFGVPPEWLVGPSIRTKFEVVYGNPTLVRVPEASFIADRLGKVTAIQEAIGRRPIAAFGNSDADLEMLQWTTFATGPRLGMIVHHTDGEREYAYDREPGFGRLDEALDAAAANRWTVIDMKADWKTIFPAKTQ